MQDPELFAELHTSGRDGTASYLPQPSDRPPAKVSGQDGRDLQGVVATIPVRPFELCDCLPLAAWHSLFGGIKYAVSGREYFSKPETSNLDAVQLPQTSTSPRPFSAELMRLLTQAKDGRFSLTNIYGETKPPYAILSHTWGPDSDEVTLRDLEEGSGESKPGYGKIRFCAKQAELDGLQHFWIDTCCIDKTNSVELSESINSMFAWYRDAARCYVYLSDVAVGSKNDAKQSMLVWEPALRASRWFTRGWTLQELIAPSSVEFFSKDGLRLGDKLSLEEPICEITGIAAAALRGGSLSRFRVDERLKWAETRQTTRPEDFAYCLLGIFSVFMPLIYGEGRENAIRRLRREIAGQEAADSSTSDAGDSRNQASAQREPPVSRPPITSPKSFSSSAGYEACRDDVIGPWAKLTHRYLIPSKFRLGIRFCVPILFVAPPTNQRGPLPNKEIVYMDGTTASYHMTHSWMPEEFAAWQRKKREGSKRRGVSNIAGHELASWLFLLMVIQRMEQESRGWQRGVYDLGPNVQPHTMAVAMQEMTQSWDTVPDGIKKPYATTAFCHVVEIAAMLGIYWKEFDQNANRYRAHGNGCSLTGSLVPNLGIAFAFETVGETWYRESRVVPNIAVKELCFGLCPTVFRADMDRRPVKTDERDKGTLQLSTPADVAETLIAFGCNTSTVNYFRSGNERTRYSHVFPIPFEMLGMVGKVIQIPHTAFTMLPNPTFLAWNRSAFSITALLRCFGEILKIAEPDEPGYFPPVLQVTRQLDAVASCAAKVLQVADKDAATSRDKELEGQRDRQIREVGSSGPWPRHTLVRLLETLHAAILSCDEFLGHNYPLVQHVFALHVQEVLAYLNVQPEERLRGAADGFRVLPHSINSSSISRAISRPSYDDDANDWHVPLHAIDSAPWEKRHDMLMRLYILYVRQRVRDTPIPAALQQYNRAADLVPELLVDGAFRHVAHDATIGGSAGESSSGGSEDAGKRPTKPQDVDDIWYTLTFRMLCWLMLHDFHKNDVQIPKSDAYGSRLPVYIL